MVGYGCKMKTDLDECWEGFGSHMQWTKWGSQDKLRKLMVRDFKKNQCIRMMHNSIKNIPYILTLSKPIC